MAAGHAHGIGPHHRPRDIDGWFVGGARIARVDASSALVARVNELVLLRRCHPLGIAVGMAVEQVE